MLLDDGNLYSHPSLVSRNYVCLSHFFQYYLALYYCDHLSRGKELAYMRFMHLRVYFCMP